MKINIPEDALEILYTLEAYGFEGYIVGGCVRDSLLNKEPKDWDITTNATPEDVIDLFASNTTVIPTGIKHGTVTVLFQSGAYEVTTYRIDGKYSDGRRPDEVQFTSSLEEDLSRRDFTINALAYNPDQGLIDPFNGYEDLQNRIIKCVGNPADRFKEDYLRIVRAYRFAIVYDFKIDERTYNAAKSRLSLGALDDISKERLQSELEKMLNATIEYDNFSMFIEIFELIIKQATQRPDDIYERLHEQSIFEVFDVLDTSNDKLAWLLFCFCEDMEQCEEILREMKYSNEVRIWVTQLLWLFKCQINNAKELKKLLGVYGFDLVEHALYLQHYLYPKDSDVSIRLKQLNVIRDENQIIKTSQLAITGDDIIKELHVPQGIIIGKMLQDALDGVIDGAIQNNKDELLRYLFYLTNKRKYDKI